MILYVVWFVIGCAAGLVIAYYLFPYPRLQTPARDDKGRFVAAKIEPVRIRAGAAQVVTEIKAQPPVKDWSAIKRGNWSKLEEERDKTDGIL